MTAVPHYDVIYGRRDRQFVPRIAKLLRFGVVPLVGGGGTPLAMVQAASVADGAVRAATCDAAGGRAYNLANDFDVCVRDFYRLAGDGLGVRVRMAPIPFALARVGFGAGMLALRLAMRGQLVAVASNSLDFITRDNPFTSERARRELGWSPPVRPAAGIPDAFRWWLEHREPR